MNQIIVVDYDPNWVTVFAQLRDRISNVVSDSAVAIEHVGSTAVPGLAAKPVIDISVVAADQQAVKTTISALASLGYVHRGDLGIEGREAFDNPPSLPAHHLYVCLAGGVALRNHLAVRDYLRADAAARQSYGQLKQKLARQHADDIDQYIAGKTEFLLNILAESGMINSELKSIERANQI